ncbi:unnamed protein product [Mesocestoides corti]|uniref:Uncharacterized protein n=1 Tax=Mesocestoides corti TaxID=53468 RepID=A0A0R3UBY0_MESCO|nr:unnamed protein product [Mesocestoides corti]
MSSRAQCVTSLLSRWFSSFPKPVLPTLLANFSPVDDDDDDICVHFGRGHECLLALNSCGNVRCRVVIRKQ